MTSEKDEGKEIRLNGPTLPAETFSVVSDIYKERINQTSKWGTEKVMLSNFGYGQYLDRKMTILIEEIGEYAKEINDKRLDEMYNEAIQAAAVLVATCEGITLMRNGVL